MYSEYMIREFHVIIEKDKNGYFARCLDLDGCFAQGETHEEVEKNIEDAIKLHLAYMKNVSEKLPESDSVSLSSVKIVVPA